MKEVEDFDLEKIQNYFKFKAQTMLHCRVWDGD